MKTKRQPTVYETTDGRQFLDAKQAGEWERLLKLRHDYEAARQAYETALAHTFTTADGVPFHPSIINDYWYVTHWVNTLPTLQRVSFSPWSFRCELESERSRLRVWDDADEHGHRPANPRREYWVDELYAHRTAAADRLLAAKREWLNQQLAALTTRD